MFSSRTDIDVSKNALAIALDERRARGEVVVDLTVSNPTTAEVPYPREAIALALANAKALTYEPAPFGIAPAREAVARAIGADASRVMLAASTSEAYAFLFKLLCDPGDDVLVPQPSYPLFDMLAAFESVRLVPYRLAYDGAWHVDLDSVRRARSPRTRAILCVSPNNPTGSFLKKVELDGLAALGLPIVSDEVFAEYPLKGDARRAGSALDAKEHALVFALGGLSKLAALPQMKLAWTIVDGPPALRDAALARLELVADSFLSVSAPVQHAASALLESGAVAREAIRARTRANLAALTGALRGSAATVLDVEGGWYATLRLPSTRSEEAWALELLAHGAYVHPGAFFGFADEPYVVVSLLTPEAALEHGARIVRACVDR